MPRGAHRLLRWVLVVLAGVFVAIQLIPVDRTNPPVKADVNAPEEVAAILKRACYNCHSNETRWPWYGYVAPVSWWLVDHVDEARGDMNFSEWPVFDFELQELAFRDIDKQVSSGEMPLPSYKILHPEARLTEDERAVIVRWARSHF